MIILSFFTKLLHFLPSELSHYLALQSLKFIYSIGLLNYLIPNQNDKIFRKSLDHKSVLSNLKNKVGFAAGLDKNGDYIDCLAALGVGFIELGTITPEPQSGNLRPRLFRNRKDRSLLNRLGFNNKGVDYLVNNLKKRKSKIAVGSSIGKNYYTSNHHAYRDYLFCLEKVYEFSDYIAINISSPNTDNLRDLSSEDYLVGLLRKIKSKQALLSSSHGYKPIFIKISPDEDLQNLREICRSIMDIGLDGIICSNTTVDHYDERGTGGLSGTPLKDKATKTLLIVKGIVENKIPIIASGGVMSVEDYQEKIDCGADLVQVYTGFIYEGPKLINDLVKL